MFLSLRVMVWGKGVLDVIKEYLKINSLNRSQDHFALHTDFFSLIRQSKVDCLLLLKGNQFQLFFPFYFQGSWGIYLYVSKTSRKKTFTEYLSTMFV